MQVFFVIVPVVGHLRQLLWGIKVRWKATDKHYTAVQEKTRNNTLPVLWEQNSMTANIERRWRRFFITPITWFSMNKLAVFLPRQRISKTKHAKTDEIHTTIVRVQDKIKRHLHFRVLLQSKGQIVLWLGYLLDFLRTTQSARSRLTTCDSRPP